MMRIEVSMADTCASAAGIMREMGEVALLLTTNPLAASTYADRLDELSGELEALDSRDADLDAALDDVSMGVSGLIEVVRNRGSDALSVVPEQVAKTQLGFMAVGSACEGVVR